MQESGISHATHCLHVLEYAFDRAPREFTLSGTKAVRVCRSHFTVLADAGPQTLLALGHSESLRDDSLFVLLLELGQAQGQPWLFDSGCLCSASCSLEAPMAVLS